MGNQKGSVGLIIIITIIVVLIIGSAYFIYQFTNKYSNKPISTNNTNVVTSSTNQPSPSPTLAATNEKNTKTYIETQYNFSFEYPSNWLIADTNEETTGQKKIITIMSPDERENTIIIIRMWKEILLPNTPLEKRVTIDEIKKTYGEDQNNFSSYTIAGVNGISLNQENTIASGTSVIFEKDNQIYEIVAAIPNNQNRDSNKQAVKEVINSFKFNN